MAMKDELTARYRSYSVAQLLEVLHNKKVYTLDAIEVAEIEFEKRQVTAGNRSATRCIRRGWRQGPRIRQN